MFNNLAMIFLATLSTAPQLHLLLLQADIAYSLVRDQGKSTRAQSMFRQLRSISTTSTHCHLLTEGFTITFNPSMVFH